MFGKRGMAVAVAAAAMVAGGASGAQAWQWAGSGDPIIMTGGGGYGNLNYQTYGSGVLQSWLRDTKLDGERVYARGYGSAGPSNAIRFESGRRTDGESKFLRMADKVFYSAYGSGVGNYRYTIDLCRDKPLLLDPCSDAKRGPHGL